MLSPTLLSLAETVKLVSHFKEFPFPENAIEYTDYVGTFNKIAEVVGQFPTDEVTPEMQELHRCRTSLGACQLRVVCSYFCPLQIRLLFSRLLYSLLLSLTACQICHQCLDRAQLSCFCYHGPVSVV